MKIVYKSLTEIMPYERNPRHNEEAVDKVARSIEEFGFRQPIVIDAAGVIVVGHTRYEAAKKLGLEKVPTTVADDLSPYQIAAYRLADNKTAEFSSWDYSLLETEMQDLKEKFDMSDFGFDSESSAESLEAMMDNLFEDGQEIMEDDSFSVTLRFPNEYREDVMLLIDTEGREYLSEIILNETKRY